MDFGGKMAVATGGANGIGRAVSLGFARHGMTVVVVDRGRRSEGPRPSDGRT